MRFSLLLLSFFFFTIASATSIYKNTNKDGEVEFTDKPNSYSEKVKVPPMNTFKQSDQPKSTVTTKPKVENTQYSNVVINSPANDSQIRSNNGTLTIIVGFEPTLKSGDSVKVIIDGNSETAVVGKSSNVFFRDIDRGTHTARAFILDSDGDVLAESGSITFHLLRYASFNRRPAAVNLPAKAK